MKLFWKRILIALIVGLIGFGVFMFGYNSWTIAHNPTAARTVTVLAILLGAFLLLVKQNVLSPDWRFALEWAAFVAPATVSLIQIFG